MRTVLDFDHEIVVVYDTLDDTSIPIIDEIMKATDNVIGVHNADGIGALNAVRAGLKAASGEYAFLYAADEVVPILGIPYMVELMDKDGCEFSAMTRYRWGGGRYGRSRLGTYLSKIANMAFRLAVGSVFSDCTSGAKMFKPDDFGRLVGERTDIGWDFAFDMAINAQCLGLRVGEVPIISVDRMFGGASTYRLTAWTKNYLKVFFRGAWKLGIHPFRRSPALVVRVPSNIPGGERRIVHPRGRETEIGA